MIGKAGERERESAGRGATAQTGMPLAFVTPATTSMTRYLGTYMRRTKVHYKDRTDFWTLKMSGNMICACFDGSDNLAHHSS